jgi:hypothetical protein
VADFGQNRWLSWSIIRIIKLNKMEITIRQAHPALDARSPLIQYHLELPLSIKFLVGSAIFALAGKGIYEMACPAYIKSGDTYEEFRHSQAQATSALLDGFIAIAAGGDNIKKRAMIMGLAVHKVNIKGAVYGTEAMHGNTAVEFVVDGRLTRNGGLAFVLGYPEVSEPVFYALRDVMDDCRRPARVACALLYGVAFTLLAGALLIQLGWAVRGMLL